MREKSHPALARQTVSQRQSKAVFSKPMPSNPTNDDQRDDSASNERVLVRTFSSQDTAELAAASLEARGIHCWITSDDGGGMIPGLAAASGVKLFVHSVDATAAATLLDAQATASELPSSPDVNEQPPAGSPSTSHKKIPIGTLLIGVILGVLLCLVYQWAGSRGKKEYGYDWNGDGREDELLVYRNGLMRQTFRDRNHDGAWDEWGDVDTNGHYSAFRQDNNFDGRADCFTTYSNGGLASHQWDTDFNGTPDVTDTFKDEVIHLTEWKPNNSIFITLRGDYTNGVLFELSRDWDGDGKFDEVVHYDAFQNPVKTNIFKLLSPASP